MWKMLKAERFRLSLEGQIPKVYRDKKGKGVSHLLHYVNKTLLNHLKQILKKIEYWLEKVNDHLEMLPKRANKATNLQKHMARHYYTWHMVSHIRVKNLKRELRKTLIEQRKKDKFDLLVEPSLSA